MNASFIDTDLENLKHQVDMLKLLLDDPQEGIPSWNILVHTRTKAVHDFYRYKVYGELRP